MREQQNWFDIHLSANSLATASCPSYIIIAASTVSLVAPSLDVEAHFAIVVTYKALLMSCSVVTRAPARSAHSGLDLCFCESPPLAQGSLNLLVRGVPELGRQLQVLSCIGGLCNGAVVQVSA